ncbi:hypothetical protein GCM10009718_00270 [Isoptericola halotolerans]|uniref:Methyltransferase domain-containing protein n=1 Tax=Isoptericola halotolerans TaxID=300560 RepID=A0ABX2A653_9MICO|nr:methyltransferase domain-containing protein [Isoptericola halotolerans]NOV98339.1 hypothetical protein [Isoptericola halotolerans]
MQNDASTDVYQDLGEFHDLFMDEPWAGLRPALTTAFADLGPQHTLLDLGAGTGLGTRTLASVTGAQIVAIEPSRTMRAVLTARVADDEDLSRRVTVRAGLLPGALDDVVGRVDGFVAAHMVGHLSEDERSATFARLRSLMTPEAVGVMTIEPAGDEGPAGEAFVQERWVGSLRYVARYLPATDERRFVSEYEVHDAERLLRSERFVGSWERLSPARLRRELSAAGFDVELHQPGAALVRLIGRTSMPA